MLRFRLVRAAVPLACVALAACTAPGLPPAIQRAQSVGPVVTGDGVAYWVAYERDGLALMRHDLATGTTVALDREANGFASEQGAGPIIVGDDAIVWGLVGAFTSCDALRVVWPDGRRGALRFDRAPDVCQGMPLAETGGKLLLLEPEASVVAIDLGTSAATPLFEPDLLIATPPVSDGHFVYGLFWNDEGMFVGRMSLEDPHEIWRVVSGVRDGWGLTLHDDQLYWIDRGYTGETPAVYGVASSANDTRQVETVATLAGDLRSLAWTGDTLWAADADGQALVRIGADGATDRFATPYVPLALAGLPDRLLVTAFAETDRYQSTVELSPLLEQPLP